MPTQRSSMSGLFSVLGLVFLVIGATRERAFLGVGYVFLLFGWMGRKKGSAASTDEREADPPQ
jgi:hypothetical protein